MWCCHPFFAICRMCWSATVTTVTCANPLNLPSFRRRRTTNDTHLEPDCNPELKEFHLANINAISKMDHIEFGHLGNIVINSDCVWALCIDGVNTQPLLLLWLVRTHFCQSSAKVWSRRCVFYLYFLLLLFSRGWNGSAKDVGTTVWDFLLLGQSESGFVPAADLSTCWASITSTLSSYSVPLRRSSWPGWMVSLGSFQYMSQL